IPPKGSPRHCPHPAGKLPSPDFVPACDDCAQPVALPARCTVPREQTRSARRFPIKPVRSDEEPMRYRVYSGPRGSAAISALDKERMLFKEFDALDGALGWARHLAGSGRVPLLIEGDDGTRLDKQAIA